MTLRSCPCCHRSLAVGRHGFGWCTAGHRQATGKAKKAAARMGVRA